MNQHDKVSLLLSKLDRINVPMVTIAPQFSMSGEEWISFMGLLESVVEKVEDKTHQAFLIDVQEALWRQNKMHECEESPDGYHHIIEWENEKISGAIFCIHCGELFVKCKLTPEELHAHLTQKGFQVGPVKPGCQAEKADAPTANTD